MFPLIRYNTFTRFTPTIPEFYRNVYSEEEGIKKILFELCKLSAYANELADSINDLDSDQAQIRLKLAKLNDRIDEIIAKMQEFELGGKARNPVTGDFSYMYVVFKQMYDLLRVHSMTWRALANSGKTWSELAGNGKTYVEVDMLANDIWGDGSEQIKYTNPDKIDINTPGFM